MSTTTSTEHPYTLSKLEVPIAQVACAWRLQHRHDLDVVTTEWLGQAVARLTAAFGVAITFDGSQPSGTDEHGQAAVVARSLFLYAEHGPHHDDPAAPVMQDRARAAVIARRVVAVRFG